MFSWIWLRAFGHSVLFSFYCKLYLKRSFFASFITEQRVWVDSDKFWYSHLCVITRSYTAFVSKNFGLNFPKIRRLRVGTESFLISISSFAKEHVYLSIMSKNCQSHGDLMPGYLTKCSLQRMITAILIFTIIFSNKFALCPQENFIQLFFTDPMDWSISKFAWRGC